MPYGTMMHAGASMAQPMAQTGSMIPGMNPYMIPKGYSVEDLQLAGACDWQKLERLVHSETQLIALLKKEGLVDSALKLEQMRDGVLAHRMASSPFADSKQFLRNNCANDAFIGKWRDDIDKFVKGISKVTATAKVPAARAIDIEYFAQSLKQQARASLPFTGYYNDQYKVPKIPPNTFKDIPYEPRFLLAPLTKPLLSGFL